MTRFVIAFLVLSCEVVFAQEAWERQKGQCDAIFQGYREADLVVLKQCTIIFETTRDVSALKPDEKAMLAGAFNRLFLEGDEETRFLAARALARIGYEPSVKDIKELEKKDKERQTKKREKYRPHTAPPEKQAQAKKIYAKGQTAMKKKDCKDALALFQSALELDGKLIPALYDTAVCYAQLGDADNAIEYLMRIQDIGDKEAGKKLREARKDKSFSGIREKDGFKRVTGFARIKVVNGMPERDLEVGQDNCYILVETLSKPELGYEVVDGGRDKHVRDRPHIWFKEHSKLQAYVIRKFLGHPRTRLVPIDWDTEWDIIVSWADKVEVDESGQKNARYSLAGAQKGSPMDPEKRLDEALREQDEALRKPEEYAQKAEKVIGTPERVVDKASSAVDRVEKTVETFERVGDKAGKVFK